MESWSVEVYILYPRLCFISEFLTKISPKMLIKPECLSSVVTIFCSFTPRAIHLFCLFTMRDSKTGYQFLRLCPGGLWMLRYQSVTDSGRTEAVKIHALGGVWRPTLSLVELPLVEVLILHHHLCCS